MITLQQSKKLSVEYGRLKAEKLEESCDIDEEHPPPPAMDEYGSNPSRIFSQW